MRESGRAALGPFALLVLRPTWIGGKPQDIQRERTSVAWEGAGSLDVPIVALRDGMIIFQFDKSKHYSGGEVPPYTLPPDRKIPKGVSQAEDARTQLAYRRFVYMNAFLLALYSACATVQKRGKPVQEPIDPLNYFGARRTDKGWETFSDIGRQVEYPRDRSDDLDPAALTQAKEILLTFNDAIGPASLEVLALTYIACHHYARHQFSSAHLIAWAVIEALQNVMWSTLQKEIDLQNGGHTAMNSDRRKLLAGRDYSASVVSQVLSVARKIDDEALARLDAARRKRNEFAHGLAPIDAEGAGKAIRLATDLITKLAGIPVTSQLSMSFWL